MNITLYVNKLKMKCHTWCRAGGSSASGTMYSLTRYMGAYCRSHRPLPPLKHHPPPLPHHNTRPEERSPAQTETHVPAEDRAPQHFLKINILPLADSPLLTQKASIAASLE